MKEKIDVSGLLFRFIFLFRNKINLFLFNYFIHVTCFIKRIKLGDKVVFNGFPHIRRYPNSNIQIGSNCKFNSAKRSVLIGLNNPCTFITLKKDSEIIFGNNSGASGVIIVAASKVIIGDNVLIGGNCTIIDNDFHNTDPNKRNLEDYPTRPIVVENNVFIGINCLIAKGVTIGENSVIGANSAVFNSIPANSIAIGNPCKVIIKKNWNNIN